MYIIYSRFSFTLPETFNTTYAKTPFPLTRGYFKNDDKVKTENQHSCDINVKKRGRKIAKKKVVAVKKRSKRKHDFSSTNGGIRKCRKETNKDRLYMCSLCKKKQYKYRRNKLRHEKYECVNGPQFGCENCGKKFSQKKTMISHIARKHPNWVKELQIKKKN